MRPIVFHTVTFGIKIFLYTHIRVDLVSPHAKDVVTMCAL